MRVWIVNLRQNHAIFIIVHAQNFEREKMHVPITTKDKQETPQTLKVSRAEGYRLNNNDCAHRGTNSPILTTAKNT